MRDTATGELFDDRAYKPPMFNDFIGLPEKVYPLSLKILEQGGDLLVYREADLAKGISRKQNFIFHLLVTVGKLASIDITVIVVTGLSGGAGRTARTLTIYDYMVEGPKQPVTRASTTQDIQEFINRWFYDRSGRR